MKFVLIGLTLLGCLRPFVPLSESVGRIAQMIFAALGLVFAVAGGFMLLTAADFGFTSLETILLASGLLLLTFNALWDLFF
jgi:hypothetical protein